MPINKYQETYDNLYKNICQAKESSDLEFYCTCFEALNIALLDKQSSEISSHITIIRTIADHLYDLGYVNGNAFNLLAKYYAENKKPLEALFILICKLLLPIYRTSPESITIISGLQTNILVVFKFTDNVDESLDFINNKIIFACHNQQERNLIKLIVSSINYNIERYYEASRIISEDILPTVTEPIDRIVIQSRLIQIYKKMGHTFKDAIIILLEEMKMNYAAIKEEIPPKILGYFTNLIEKITN